jgi:RNA polymerase sigma-70 factor (ECF subfamily)
MTRPDEALWVLRAQCGDREALERLLVEVQPALRRYLVSLVGAAEAEDLAQEALLQIYRKLAWLRAPELFRPWAVSDRQPPGVPASEKKAPAASGSGRAGARDDFAAAEPPTASELAAIPAIAGVSPASRAVLHLHFQHDLTLAEVAVVLDIPLGTVRSRLAYGLAVLARFSNEGDRHDGSAS